MGFLELPNRCSGKRTYGLTSIVDFGTPIGELRNILDEYHHLIDIAKIGIGSAYVTPNLKRKIDLYKEYQVNPYCGGTLFEKSYYQKRIPEYIKYLLDIGITSIEISNGTFDIPLETRLELVHQFKKDFRVIAEVGSKDADKEMPITNWKKEIQLFLNAGCEYVITEGRDSGTSGIYDCNGEIKTDLINELIKDIDEKRIIFEAPTPKQQMYFIKQIGPNVNLGNIKISDVLLLETQRCGLRSETFYLEDRECNLL